MNEEITTFVEILTAETSRSRIAAAAESLLHSGASLDGPPPRQLIAALIENGPAIDEPLLNLARAWSPLEMSRTMLDQLSALQAPHQREQVAWLLKTVLALEHSGEAIDLVLNVHEQPEVRSWLVEGLERMAFAGSLGWDQLEPVISCLAAERDPVLRVRLASLLTALPWRGENVRLLDPLLLDDNHEVVSAAAHTLARRPDAIRSLAPQVLSHLRSHLNLAIRQSAALLDKSLRSAETTK